MNFLSTQDPFYFLFLIIGISLLPFLAALTTSFAKIVVVLSLTRQAIGTPSAPPNIVIISLSLVLTMFSMYPVFLTIYDDVYKNWPDKPKDQDVFFLLLSSIKEPIKDFMKKNTKENNIKIFTDILKEKDPNNKFIFDEFFILAPAFLISELSKAFQIGFLVFLPFLVVDLVIANLLMSLGMQMLSPIAVSLPFKILLFVLVDGFSLLAQGLLKG